MHVGTIRLGRREMDNQLAGRPVDGVHLPGGGRPRVEKITQDRIIANRTRGARNGW